MCVPFFAGGEHSHSHDSHMDDTHQHDNFGNDHSHAHSLKDLSIGLSVLGKWKILLYLSTRIEWLLSLNDISSICKTLLTFTLTRVRASKTHFGNCQVRNYNGCCENSRIFKNRELSLSLLWPCGRRLLWSLLFGLKVLTLFRVFLWEI